MYPLRWLIRSASLILLLTCALSGAAVVGRGRPATLVVARIDSDVQDGLPVAVIDAERELIAVRRIHLPFLSRVDWNKWPPEVEQREPVLDINHYTLSVFDEEQIRFVPAFSHRLHNRSRGLEFVRSGSSAAVYVRLTGEVSLLREVLAEDLRVSTAAGELQSLVWSPDGHRLAVKAFRAAPLILLDESGSRTVEVFRDSAPLWSPDSRSILFTQDSFIERNGRLRAIDAESGKVLATVNDLAGRSGVWCSSDTIAFVYVVPGGRHSVQVLDVPSGRTKQVLDPATTGNQEILSLGFAPRPECDWLILTMRHPQELATRLYRLHIPSGELTRLGENARVLALTPGAIVYDSNAARVALSVERAAFEVETEPEVLGRVSSQIEDVVWYGDFRQGIFLRSGQLWRIDLTSRQTRPLAVSVPVASFLIAPAVQ